MGTPIRPEPQSLSELMGQRQREREAQNPVPDLLRTSADATKDQQPGRAARVLRVQGKTAWPTDFIDRNLEVLEIEVDKPEFDAERFWKESPAIAAWMAQDPTRVAAAKGRDMERMGRVEGYLKAIGTEFERNRITTQLVEPGLAAMFGRATPEQEAELTRLRERQQALPDVLGTRGFVSGIPIAAIGQLPVTLSLYKGAGVGAGVGAATGAAVGAVRGALGGPAGAATGAATGAVRGALLGSRAGVVVEGIKLEAANAFLDYREMEGVDRETAAVGALIAGTISGALELLPFENAAKAIPGLRRLGKDGIREMLMAPTTRRLLQRYAGQVMSQMAAEGVTEGLQELVQIAGGVLTERYADGTLSLLSTDTILREIFAPENLSRIGSAARTGAQSGGGFGAATGGVSTAVDLPAVRRAELNAQRMQAAAEAIHGNDREEAVTLAKAAPDAMKQAVAAVGSEGVYYDINEFTAYWQDQRRPDGEAANPREVAIALGVTPEAYDAAVESGAPINIPTQNLLVDALATDAHRQWFVDNLRVTPNELSKAEATKQREAAMAPVEEVADVEAMPTREQEAETAVAALRERVTAELRQARVGPEEAQASVALWTEAAKAAIARNPDVPVAEVLRRFDRVQIVAQPVAAYPDGKAVSRFEVTGETMPNAAGVQVPVLKSTRQARATAARYETLLAERGEAKLTEKQRTELDGARQALADAERVNATLTPVDFAALRGPVDVQGMTPEQRASVNVEANRDVLEQAAFHGSPYVFDKFSLSAIGTGEGAQAYGWGLYFAESEAVAGEYQRTLSAQSEFPVQRFFRGERLERGTPEYHAASLLEGGRTLAAVRKEVARWIVEADNWSDRRRADPSEQELLAGWKRTLALLEQATSKKDFTTKPHEGALYRVDIPDEAVARMLDWDKPLSEQAPEVRTALESFGFTLDTEGLRAFDDALLAALSTEEDTGPLPRQPRNPSGDSIYKEISRKQGGYRNASLALLAAGIPGIKYLDAGSRADGDGTRNLVVFDDALVTITHRNGEPVTAQERADFLAQEATPAEMPETLDVDGMQRPTRNSEGRPIHPTEEGVRNFWRWFAGSRVVDAEGRPLVVYRSDATNFHVFDRRKAKEGFFFRIADSYSRGYGGNPRPFYLNIQNPLDTGNEGPNAQNATNIKGTDYDGVINDGNAEFVAVKNTQIKSADANTGEFGPTPNILRQGAQDPRGAFIAPAGRVDGPRLVALFKERNQSTFLHETAHAFLDLWTDLAADPQASPEFRALVSGVRAELGATEGERLSVAQEEQFAGLFLDYAKSGKAPSVALRQAFASFAAFLTKLWSFVKGEIVPANENVRDLLDRLLATDDAIAEARGEFMAPLFPEDAAINAAFVAARTEAEEQTRTEAMRAVVRAEQEWWKRTERQVAEEVRENVNRDPAYIARQILTTGRMPDGSELPAGSPLLSKLNRAQVVGILGEDATKQLPRGKTGAVYNTQGEGLDLAIAAEVLGYANGPELLSALQQTQPIDEHVANVTKATMRERYGDPLTEVPEVAVDALHNDSLDRMRQLEMEAILRDHPEAFREAMVRAASRPVNVRELKEWATERLANRPLNTIRPAEYLSAERKATREAIRAVADGEWAKAVQAKAKQRYAAALYAEAVKVKEAVTKFQDLTAKVFGPDERIAKTRNLDIVMAARQLLASVGVGRRENDTQFYLAQLAEYDPETAATLEGVVADFNVAPRDDFKSLSVAEFENVRSAVQELWDTAKQAETLTIAGRKISKAVAVSDMTSVLVTMRDSAVEGAGVERVAEFRDKANRAVLTAKASLRRVESWVDLMDGGNINGPFRRYIFAQLRDKTAEKAEANTKDLLAYDAMLAAIRPTLTNADIAAPELGRAWVFKGKAHLLGTLLHTGNPSNMAMLLNGRGWTMDGWMRFRDRMVAEGVLTPADFDFVQQVWNLFEAKKPEAQNVYRRMFGRYFDEITREGFTIRFPDGTERTYAGGYTPATKDPDASTAAEKRAADNLLEEAYGMRFPTVQRGFTIGRVQNFEPLLLSLDIVPKHLDAVNKFIYLAEPVREVGRLLRDRTLRAELDRVNPAIVNDLLMPWVQRTATQVVQTPTNSVAVAKYVDPIAKYLRTTAGASFMFLNVANTLEQATGLSVAAVRVNPKYLSLSQAAVLRNAAQVTEVMEQDNPFMRERNATQFTEVRRRIDDITTDPNVFQKAQAFAAEHAYILQATAQSHIDRIVWYGSYLESLDAGLSVAEARAKANADVRLTQGSFDAVDVARIETGNPWWRLIAMFAGYFNMLANLNATEMQKAVDAMGLKKSMPRLFAVYALGFAVPIMASNLIRKAMLGRAALNDVDGDDEWGYLDDFFAWFFGEQARAGAAMVPGAGQTINYVANLFDDKAFNDQLSISPAISFVEAAGRGVKANYDLLTGESLARRDIRDMLSLFSLMSRIPATGFARPLTYLYDIETGRAEPTGPVDVLRGLSSGAPGR